MVLSPSRLSGMSPARDALGVALRTRGRERAEPTEIGLRVLAEAAAALRSVERIHEHCAGWSGLAGLGEYIEILPPQMRVSKEWYQGTADAVYQNIYSIGSERSKYVFILSGDHIYKMNYAKMLQQHIDSGADVTVGTIQIPTHEAAKQFGVIEVDKDWRIAGFEEKPAHPKESPHSPGQCNASMGIYIFNTQLLIPILLADAEDPKTHRRERPRPAWRR